LEQSNSFFDDLIFDPKEAERQKQEFKAKADKLDNLIHATFAQNESGVELLQLWTEALIMTSTAEPNMGKVEIGINEGQKRFIKAILLTIKRVETNE